jgi:dUTP pyrophosphatase
MRLQVKRGRLERATERSAGYDLFSTEAVLLRPGERARVETGVETRFDNGMVGLICDKSGLAAKFGLTVLAGVIDGDYDKTWGVVLLNTGIGTVAISPGHKVAQVLFLSLAPLTVEVAPGAEFVERDAIREGGFGSTGT